MGGAPERGWACFLWLLHSYGPLGGKLLGRLGINNMNCKIKNILNECRLLILFDFQLRTLFFSGTEQFFPGAQAFASPPDIASSGEAMSGELAKACVLGKIVLFQRKIEFLIEKFLG